MTDPTVIERFMRDANPIPHVDDLDSDEFARFVTVVNTRREAAMQTSTDSATRPTPTRTPTPPQRGRAWAFALAIILVLAGVGIVALLVQDDGVPVVEQPAPPVTESFTWSRVPHDERLFSPGEGTEMLSVTVGGPGLVAVGSDVWTSHDGISWSLIPHDPAVFGYGSMSSVTVGGPGLVAVGIGSVEGTDYAVAHATVWTSPDGVNWSLVPYDTEVFGSHDGDDLGTWMRGVTVGGPGLVAVGNDRSSAAVWTSPDGMNWSRVPHDPEVFGEGATWESHTGMTSVTAGGPGLVAVGHDDGYSNAAIWTSPDGFTWTRVPHDESVFGGRGGQVINAVTAGGPGLVAVGEDEPDSVSVIGGIRAAVWTSPDGTTWTRVPHDAALFGGEGTDERNIRAVTLTDSGLVAVGGAAHAGVAVWTSPDGITWTQVQLDAELSSTPEINTPGHWAMNSVAAGGPGLVAVGQEDDAAAIWLAAPQD